MSTLELRRSLENLLLNNKEALVDRWVYTTCGYCGTGCGLYLGIKDGRAVAVRPNPTSPVNRGHLCLKGTYEWKTLEHPERATQPLLREGGQLKATTWERAQEAFVAKIREALDKGGPEAIGIYHGGQLTLEEYYALHKLAKGVLGTPNIDANTRLCMASTVSGYIKSFGIDAPPGCYEDLDIAQVIFIFGANPAEMHPQLWQRILRNRQSNQCKIIVADPRRTLPASIADLHLRLRCGTNIPLLYAIIHVLIREDLIDKAFIKKATAGFEALAAAARQFTPEVAEEITGVPSAQIIEAAHIFGRADTAVTIFCQGVNQSLQPVDTVTLINSLHLITGKIGRPGCAPFSLTGQASALSMREIGGAGCLPGLRNPENPRHRQEVARYWGIEEKVLPAFTNDINTMLELIASGRLQVLWVIGTNPAVSLAHQEYVREQLKRVYLVVQDVFYPMETAAFADIFFPAAQWGEKTGTITNSERRVNLVQKAVDPPGQAQDDLTIICQIARCMGAGELFPWQHPEEVFAELKELTRNRPDDMTGITYELLETQGGIQWPCPDVTRQGTPRLYTDATFPTAPEVSQAYGKFNESPGRARLWAVPWTPSVGLTNGDYPFWLNTGRVIEHYHTRTKTKRIPELNTLVPHAFVEINPQDAAALGVAEGEWVKVVSPQGWVKVRAHLTEVVAPGEIFLPFHFGDLDPGERQYPQAANHLTARLLDPCSRQPLTKVAACRIEKISL